MVEMNICNEMYYIWNLSSSDCGGWDVDNFIIVLVKEECKDIYLIRCVIMYYFMVLYSKCVLFYFFKKFFMWW